MKKFLSTLLLFCIGLAPIVNIYNVSASTPLLLDYQGRQVNENQITSESVPFEDITQGELIVQLRPENDPNAFSKEEKEQVVSLPLKHTSVQANISGFTSRTVVTQEFQNPYSYPIEAIYHFPLPHDASVDNMEMTIGDKKIIGKIDTRKEAEKKYEVAKQQGKTAALLNQERPNIFTQKIANILPGDQIRIQISYFEVIKYNSGKYTYIFPMVVGPRYIPDSVTDGSNITSPTIPAGTREGHTIDVTLRITAGVNIKGLQSTSHDVQVRKISDSEAEITLKKGDTIPNKDFSMEYIVAGEAPQIGVLTHKESVDKEGYFTLLVEPQKSPKSNEIRDKEIIFVLDTSGSMQGRPIETVKLAMKKAIENLRPNDSFNIYNFNTQVFTAFPTPKVADESSKKQGLAFVDSLVAGGGTIMLEPFKQALKDTDSKNEKLRIILGMTDGDVGNDSEILQLLSNNLGNNRLFMFGVDAAANRHLIDKMAESGKGKSIYVLKEDDVNKKVEEFYQGFASPLLTDIQVDWDGLKVSEILPGNIPDLYAGQPLAIAGKYNTKGLFTSGDTERNITITAKQGNEKYTQTVKMKFKEEENENGSVAAFWARQKINEIYRQNRFSVNPKLEEEVTALGLNFSIMSEFTSFIAVDDTIRSTATGSAQIVLPVYSVEGKEEGYSRRGMGQTFSQGAMMKSARIPSGIDGAQLSVASEMFDSTVGMILGESKSIPSALSEMNISGENASNNKNTVRDYSPNSACIGVICPDVEESTEYFSFICKDGITDYTSCLKLSTLLGIGSVLLVIITFGIIFYRRKKVTKDAVTMTVFHD